MRAIAELPKNLAGGQCSESASLGCEKGERGETRLPVLRDDDGITCCVDLLPEIDRRAESKTTRENARLVCRVTRQVDHWIMVTLKLCHRTEWCKNITAKLQESPPKMH